MVFRWKTGTFSSVSPVCSPGTGALTARVRGSSITFALLRSDTLRRPISRHRSRHRHRLPRTALLGRDGTHSRDVERRSAASIACRVHTRLRGRRIASRRTQFGGPTGPTQAARNRRRCAQGAERRLRGQRFDLIAETHSYSEVLRFGQLIAIRRALERLVAIGVVVVLILAAFVIRQ
jgi:hypothetical protein